MFEDGQRQRRISNSRSYEQHEQKQQQLSSEFQRQLEAAILEEQLQDSLNRINSHAPVWIVTGALQAPYEYERAPPSNLAELSPKTKTNVPMGTLIGMVVAALLALVLGTALLVRRRHHKKRLSHFEIKQQDTSSEDEDGGKSSKGVKSPFDFDYDQRDQCGFSFDYNQRERKHLLELETAAAVPSAAHNAYSPGWAGYASSYSSNSDSEAEQNYSLPHSYCSPDNKGRVVSTVPKDYLVDIGASWAREGYEQAASSNSSITSAEDVDKTLAELDASIEKGDWAAVGVAAAGLLAFPEYADDAASRASSRRSSDRDHKQAASPQRETEIDRLIECGDWEAVIMAASRFDAEETLSPIVQARRLSLSSSNSSIGLLQSMDEGGEKSSRSKNVGARSRTTTMSEANTQIRDQIEELVQDVVPEEMDNIDELIFQFQGQEEELLETLRTMKERFVSQKARLARNKLAQRVALETMAQRPALETVAFNNNNVNNITISSVSSNSYTASSNTISGSSLVQQEAWRGVTSFSKSVEPPNNTARSLSDMTAKDEAEEGQFVGGRDKSGHLI